MLTYNVHAVCTYVLATGRIVETNLPGFDYSHEARDLYASFVTRATLKAALYIAQFRKCATAPWGFAKWKLTVSRRNDLIYLSVVIVIADLLSQPPPPNKSPRY